MSIQVFLEIIMLLVVFIGVLGLTYFVTKKMAQLNKQMVFNKNMQIVEVLQLTQGQYLYIVKVGQTYHMVGSTQKGCVSYCTEIDEKNLHFDEASPVSFKEQLSYLMKGRQMNEEDKK